MNIIKLNAIDSTNLYLKKLAKEMKLENYTVVVARHQTAGRGQMGASWVSESNKNLTFSLLSKFDNLKVEKQFYVSMAVALAVIDVLKKNVKNSLLIKWPNDILADGYKISGILIESVLKKSFVSQSIIGIGLNVNQQIFSTNIGKVSSLKLLSGTEFKTDELLIDLIKSLTLFLEYVNCQKYNKLSKLYFKNLYKYNEPAMFEDAKGIQFLGKITGVSEDGRLVVTFENKTSQKFNLKEIKFVGS